MAGAALSSPMSVRTVCSSGARPVLPGEVATGMRLRRRVVGTSLSPSGKDSGDHRVIWGGVFMLSVIRHKKAAPNPGMPKGRHSFAPVVRLAGCVQARAWTAETAELAMCDNAGRCRRQLLQHQQFCWGLSRILIRGHHAHPLESDRSLTGCRPRRQMRPVPCACVALLS